MSEKLWKKRWNGSKFEKETEKREYRKKRKKRSAIVDCLDLIGV